MNAMDSITNIPKSLISDILLRHTGTYIEPDKIDFVTAELIANAIVALDAELITKDKYMKVIEFTFNNILDREGILMRFEPSKANTLILNIYLFYN
jgi:hypothetical protein